MEQGYHISKPHVKASRKVSFCIAHRDQTNNIATVEIFKSIIYCDRPVDALSKCYDFATEISKKVQWLCYEPSIYSGIVKRYLNGKI
jgi:hypothetical protein